MASGTKWLASTLATNGSRPNRHRRRGTDRLGNLRARRVRQLLRWFLASTARVAI